MEHTLATLINFYFLFSVLHLIIIFFRVVLTTLPESEKAYHECTVVFLTPGEYKIDIQCSTTEPILDEIPIIKDTDPPSIIQPCSGEVSHIWRFIPPVAISVTD